jgi:uncharacterized membrane protein YqgA involved in biofilm formation
MALQKTARILRKHTHPRIQLQLVMFTIIAIIMFGIVIYDVANQGISLWWVVGGALLGIIVGYAIGWVYKIRWNEDTKRVIQKADRLSFLLIGLYLVVRIGGQEALGQFVHGQALVAALYSIIAGIMTGRIIALGMRINKVLKSKKLL